MNKMKTAISLLATAILPLSGMAQTNQQPAAIPAQPAQQEQQGGAQMSQDDLAKAITDALTRQIISDDQEMQEQVSITVGEKRVLSVPFSIDSCRYYSSCISGAFATRE